MDKLTKEFQDKISSSSFEFSKYKAESNEAIKMILENIHKYESKVDEVQRQLSEGTANMQKVKNLYSFFKEKIKTITNLIEDVNQFKIDIRMNLKRHDYNYKLFNNKVESNLCNMNANIESLKSKISQLHFVTN